MERKKKTMIVLFVILLCIVLVISVVGIVSLRHKTITLQGQVEATEIRLSAMLPGHIDSIYIAEGMQVLKGDTLVLVSSPSAEAQYRGALALNEVAIYQNRKIDAGTRSETVISAQQMWNKSKTDLQLAKKTYERISALYKDSVVTSQRMDEVAAMYASAQDAERVAYEQYKMAKSGARPDDRESARSMVNATSDAAKAIDVLLNEQIIVAPCGGEISGVYPHQGELVSMGTPILSISQLSDAYVVLNVREDLLPRFPMDTVFYGNVPGIAEKNVPFRVYSISPLGSFATWRSTKQVGSYDMRTFQIKARPENSVQGLRPGMSVLINIDK